MKIFSSIKTHKIATITIMAAIVGTIVGSSVIYMNNRPIVSLSIDKPVVASAVKSDDLQNTVPEVVEAPPSDEYQDVVVQSVPSTIEVATPKPIEEADLFYYIYPSIIEAYQNKIPNLSNESIFSAAQRTYLKDNSKFTDGNARYIAEKCTQQMIAADGENQVKIIFKRQTMICEL